jgi:Skp family chaperone for outer membrane proteins
MNWAEDAKRLFKGETEDEKRQRELLTAMDKLDAEASQKRRADDEAKAKADELKNLDESLAYLTQEQEDLKVRQAEITGEIKRLQSLRKAG